MGYGIPTDGLKGEHLVLGRYRFLVSLNPVEDMLECILVFEDGHRSRVGRISPPRSDRQLLEYLAHHPFTVWIEHELRYQCQTRPIEIYREEWVGAA